MLPGANRTSAPTHSFMPTQALITPRVRFGSSQPREAGNEPNPTRDPTPRPASRCWFASPPPPAKSANAGTPALASPCSLPPAVAALLAGQRHLGGVAVDGPERVWEHQLGARGRLPRVAVGALIVRHQRLRLVQLEGGRLERRRREVGRRDAPALGARKLLRGHMRQLPRRDQALGEVVPQPRVVAQVKAQRLHPAGVRLPVRRVSREHLRLQSFRQTIWRSRVVLVRIRFSRSSFTQTGTCSSFKCSREKQNRFPPSLEHSF
mmetsp:Transcript_4214/g.12051  ORF Transcript_4214/g.12051 Transcript_4214/m.12051 type:complete len:264 (-) Transcript_4214:257-1048(-)